MVESITNQKRSCSLVVRMSRLRKRQCGVDSKASDQCQKRSFANPSERQHQNGNIDALLAIGLTNIQER